MTLYQVDPTLAVGSFAVETFDERGDTLRLVRASSPDQLRALVAYEQHFPPMLLTDRDAAPREAA